MTILDTRVDAPTVDAPLPSLPARSSRPRAVLLVLARVLLAVLVTLVFGELMSPIEASVTR